MSLLGLELLLVVKEETKVEELMPFKTCKISLNEKKRDRKKEKHKLPELKIRSSDLMKWTLGLNTGRTLC